MSHLVAGVFARGRSLLSVPSAVSMAPNHHEQQADAKSATMHRQFDDIAVDSEGANRRAFGPLVDTRGHTCGLASGVRNLGGRRRGVLAANGPIASSHLGHASNQARFRRWDGGDLWREEVK